MATFLSNSLIEARQKIRNFPQNWIQQSNTAGQQFYQCKSDPSIFAQIEYAERNTWVTTIDQYA